MGQTVHVLYPDVIALPLDTVHRAKSGVDRLPVPGVLFEGHQHLLEVDEMLAGFVLELALHLRGYLELERHQASPMSSRTWATISSGLTGLIR